jgi:hypothetical protein
MWRLGAETKGYVAKAKVCIKRVANGDIAQSGKIKEEANLNGKHRPGSFKRYSRDHEDEIERVCSILTAEVKSKEIKA